MKPGEMTAQQDVKLLRQYAAAMYAYTNALVGSEDEKQADAKVNELESKILARLNSGGSPEMVHMPPLGTTAGTHKLKEDAAAEVPPEEVAGIGHAEASEPLQPAVIRGGASQPLQRRAPHATEGDGMRKAWQVIHHIIAHPLIGLSGGRLWAWKFHDWTLPRAWPNQKHEVAQRWVGLE